MPTSDHMTVTDWELFANMTIHEFLLVVNSDLVCVRDRLADSTREMCHDARNFRTDTSQEGIRHRAH